jgi:putative phosphoribosyl transferase
MFRDRADAGEKLAAALRGDDFGEGAVVLGIPRGGVEVAAVVARALAAPLDIVVVRKIGAPGNPEFAAGAVDPDGNVIANPDSRVSEAYLHQQGAAEQHEAIRRIAEYRGGRPEPDLEGRDAIVVDDGIATGLAALRWLRRRGAKRVVLAVPVISPSAVRMITPEVDELVALEVPPDFYAVGAHYARFNQLTDAEVKALLAGAQV